ncbi:MAG: ABC transporter substrate-binding protein [Cyanobacteria bacterium P01_F01_bin.143]
MQPYQSSHKTDFYQQINRLVRLKSRLVITVILFLASLVLTLSLVGCLFQEDPLMIAVALGVDEPIDIGVQQAINGVEYYVQEINQNGGINGKKLQMQIFNDSNDPLKAPEIAREIAETTNALVVLGHNFSDTSMVAGSIYEQLGVPVISGVATNDRITEDNDWYFRTIMKGSSQANFLAFYLKQVLDYSNVSLIYNSGEEYSNFMRQAFEQGTQKNRVTIKNKWDITAITVEERSRKIQTMAQELKATEPEDVGAIVVLTLEDPAFRIIAEIKRQGLSYRIFGANSFSSSTFARRFQNYPEELRSPGYFTHGVFSISPLTFDILGEQAQQFKRNYLKNYNQEPSWVAAAFYHAAKVAGEAFKRADITGNLEVLDQERQKVRDEIAAMNSLETAVAGINGPIYFDANGDTTQNVTISSTVNNYLVPYVEQLTPMTLAKPADDLAADLAEGKILKFGEQFLNLTDVVYIGVRPRQISELDLEQKTCQLDFDLWFRYSTAERLESKKIIEDIHFLNSVSEIDLGDPVKGVVTNEVSYDIYSVSGTFNLDFLESDRNFGEHIIGISFLNNQVSQSHLIYVIDSLGLRKIGDQSFIEIIQNDQVLNPKTGWEIAQVTFFQDSTRQENLGNPRMIVSQGEDAQFSRFNFAMTIARNQISLRRIIGRSSAIYLFGFAAAILGLLSFQKRYPRFNLSNSMLWWLKVFASLIFLFSLEVIVLKSLQPIVSANYIEVIVKIFDILWWFIPVYFLGQALELFFWQPLAHKTGQPIPTLVHRMVLIIMYLLASFGVVAYVFNQPLTNLLATSGLVFTIIGLALQMNISNIFSGLALNLERTFRVGDYIEIQDEDIKGYVADITWRATHIETTSGDTIFIPNSVINDKTIINYMRPQTISRATIPFTLTQETPSDWAMEVFQHALSNTIIQHPESLLSEPAPEVLFGGTDSLGIIYELNFWYVPTDINFEQIQNIVVQNVLRYLQKENINLAHDYEG